MRQVGDRLIPVGVTSGRVHTLPTVEGADGQDGGGGTPGSTTGSRRRRGPRANGQPDLSQLLGQMGLGGQDLEEVCPHRFIFSPDVHLTLAHGYGSHASLSSRARSTTKEGRRENASRGTSKCRGTWC